MGEFPFRASLLSVYAATSSLLSLDKTVSTFETVAALWKLDLTSACKDLKVERSTEHAG